MINTEQEMRLLSLWVEMGWVGIYQECFMAITRNSTGGEITARTIFICSDSFTELYTRKLILIGLSPVIEYVKYACSIRLSSR